MPALTVSFSHLERLSDKRGLFEHATGIERRKEHGYCTDDNARLLVVACREPDTAPANRLGRLALDFVLASQDRDGRTRNRMDRSGRWTDEGSTEDCWGRSTWALGVAAAQHPDTVVRARALMGFDVAVQQRSAWPRAMAFAALGAAEVLAAYPDHNDARALLVDTLLAIGTVPDGTWRWPEPRLRYANAALAEAVIAAGSALQSPTSIERGLTMLGWLLNLETRESHLSVTAHGGRGPDDTVPMFDQQSIEIASMADACWRAHAITGDDRWSRGIEMCASWFLGGNDTGSVMHDPESGGGFDGLQAVGVNLNQGAESTLALVSTMQRANQLAALSASDGPHRGLLTDSGINLQPDHKRVVVRLFVPGREDVGPGDSRATPVVDRVLSLSEVEVEAALHDVDVRFAHRHAGLHQTFEDHAAMVTSRIDSSVELSRSRLLLLGAAFTHEYAIEGAALCNPSIVVHPEQDDSGDTRFILSVRGVGEGHRSSIGFRTGRVTAAGHVSIDRPGPFPRLGTTTPAPHHRSVFHVKLAEIDDDRENAAVVLNAMQDRFDDTELALSIESLAADGATRRHTGITIANLRRLARSSYAVAFDATADLSERVLWPHAPAESHGMEDARFVRFTDDSGNVVYYATYTAFDGINIAQHLLETEDFATFVASPMAGAAAVGKGLAIFPRKVGGRYAALSRSDRETNAVAFSDDIRCWLTSEVIQISERPWEILQLGNCGSPIETDDGWLVLTHGVGPMRTYALGAILLDLHDPQRVLARSALPILTPAANRRDGYVPNVVYTCGAFAQGDMLVLPYGIADQSIAVATLSIKRLLGTMRAEP
jgi:predicted GH43/DUF377 family glycosyl hydrolase